MALYGPATSRPLPQPPMYGGKDRDATWYEHEERMRPSYISQPMYQQPAFYTASPPVSPSARWNTTQQATVASTQVLPSSVSQRQMASRQPLPQPQPHSQQQHPFPSAPHRKSYDPLAPQVISRSPQREQLRPTDARPRPQHLNSAPSRFQNAQNLYRPFSYDNEEGGQRTGMAKGSAFMHKGFFDIMSLMNNQTSPSRSNGQMPANVGGLKATFSKATGRFRRTSMQAAPPSSNNEDPFFSSPAPQMIPKIGSPPNLSPPSNRMSISPAPASISAGTALGGPRAQKKRISIDMVGAPQVESFVHAAHASDAEQAETILRRWSRDGVGKIADPAWIDRCKEAMRMQAARNQAEAIAEVQAALHQDSLISQNPRALQVKNGAPSPSSVNNSNFTFATNATGATIGHTNLSADSGTTVKTPGFEGIAEEHEIVKRAPLTPQRSPYASPPIASRPGMMPRTNTQGTILVAPSPDPAVLASAAESTPDYLQYQPNPAQSPLADATKNRMTNKNIDGLPGGAGGINALFERPVSIVLREAAIEPVALNLAGEELASPLVANAGAALRPSLTTVEKSVAAKIFFENLYYGILKKPRDRDTRKAGLERELASLRISDTAKNAIRAAWAANETEYLRDLRARVTVNSFVRLKTIGHGAFGVVALVREQGTGGLFAMKQLRKADMLRKGQEGHVRAERDLMTSASASTSARWIVKLVYSFQDVDHLYLIMEFMGGGDLLNLLIEKDIFAEDFARFYVAEMILAIHEAHHLGYIHRDIKPDNFLFSSEGHIKLADFGLCQSFHWAHDGAYYDQQRKNMLKKHGIDLEDSGATRTRKALPKVAASVREQQQQKAGGLNERELNDVMSDRNEDGTPLTHVLTWRDKNKKKIAYSVVGTNNYMAPEVLRGLGYDQSCDWWSLGVIVFEMLYGYPPFVSKSRHLTRQKILNWKQTLRFPPKPKVSREAQDFITRLICDREDRLGSTSSASVSRPNSLLQGSRQPSGFAAGSATPEGSKSGLVDGVEDLMAHPWFRSVDWNRIHTSKPPFKPALSHPADTKHFEDDIEDEPLPAPGAAEAAKDGQPAPVEPPRDPMLRDKTQGKHLLEMRKQLAFVGYTFKSPKGFDPKTQLTESKIRQAEEGSLSRQPTESGSRLRSMSM